MASAIALAVLIVLTAVQLGALALFLRHPGRVARRSETLARPPVSVLLPIKALDEGFVPALESVYRQDYPEFEVLVCAESDDLPALATAREVAGRHPGRPTRFQIAPPGQVLNPKINTLIPGFTAARHNVILVRDSNIVLAPEHLAQLVAALTEKIGLVCAIPAADVPSGFPALIEQAAMNGRDAPFTLAAATLGIDVGYGKVMLFRRGEFEAIGGIAAISDDFGDDHALSRGLSQLGLATVYDSTPAIQRLGRRTLRAVWTRQLRWMVIRRRQAFAAFSLEPFVGTPLSVLAAILAAPALGVSQWMAVLAATVWRIAAEVAVLRLAGWPMAAGYPLAALVRDVMLLLIWFPAWRKRRVDWVGRSHKLSTEVRSTPRPAGRRP